VRPLLDIGPPGVIERSLPVVRKVRGFQISAEAMRVVRGSADGTSLLVFGVGRDSSVWETLNRRGKTVFLEDVPEWVELSLAESPTRKAYLISYSTRVGTSDYETVSQIPLPDLPAAVAGALWDVVVVDGPQGFDDNAPGRASSIALAATLVRPGGLVLIDDFDRPLEARVARLVFGRSADEVLDPRRPVGVYRSD